MFVGMITGARLHLPWQLEKEECEGCGDEDISKRLLTLLGGGEGP